MMPQFFGSPLVATSQDRSIAWLRDDGGGGGGGDTDESRKWTVYSPSSATLSSPTMTTALHGLKMMSIPVSSSHATSVMVANGSGRGDMIEHKKENRKKAAGVSPSLVRYLELESAVVARGGIDPFEPMLRAHLNQRMKVNYRHRRRRGRAPTTRRVVDRCGSGGGSGGGGCGACFYCGAVHSRESDDTSKTERGGCADYGGDANNALELLPVLSSSESVNALGVAGISTTRPYHVLGSRVSVVCGRHQRHHQHHLELKKNGHHQHKHQSTEEIPHASVATPVMEAAVAAEGSARVAIVNDDDNEDDAMM
jgi:hypothetical protein